MHIHIWIYIYVYEYTYNIVERDVNPTLGGNGQKIQLFKLKSANICKRFGQSD